MRSPLILLENHLFSASIGQQTEQSESLIIAQVSTPTPISTTSSGQQTIAFPALLTIPLTVLGTLALVTLVLSQKNKLSAWLNGLFSPETVSSREISSQEFAVDIEVSNIRTQDYLRANVQATIYVFIADKDKQKAQKCLVEEEQVSAVAVEKAVKKRAETALRGSASKHTLDDLHKNRADVGKEAQDELGNCLNPLGLTVRTLIVGEIEENANYTSNNYFDAKAVAARTKVIQPAILETRTQELKTEEAIRKQELDTEEEIRKQELEKGRDIKLKELDIGMELENKEVTHQETSLLNLTKLEKVETAKIDYELNIEKYQNQQEKKLQEEIEISELNLRETIENLRNRTEIAIQLNKITEDTKLIEENKNFQLNQTTAHQEIETGEIDATILIIEKERKRLETEKKRAQAEEDVTTAIEEAQALRQQLQAEIAAGSVENEARTIERLAEAEGKRYHLIPATDADRTAQMIRELAPELMKNLPQIVEIAKALAPQAGILGDSNIYTFPNGNGEDINKLMLSTSAMSLIQSLLNGKLGDLLSEFLLSRNNNSGG